ncbi:hypothetical protein ACFFRR_001797 [Megaselia abdita]
MKQLLCLVLLATSCGATVYTTKKALAPIIALRLEYVSLEKSLWQYLSEPTKNNEAKQLRKVFETHRNVVNGNFSGDFDPIRYSILINHFEWNNLEVDLLELDGLFKEFRAFINRYLDGDYDKEAILDLCKDVLHENENSINIPDVIEKIHNAMVRQTLYYRAMLDGKEHICATGQSAQQFVYSLYSDIALTELKGYMLMQFSWMMLRAYNKGNFSEEAESMRKDYEQRSETTIRLLQKVINRSERYVWKCDPSDYVKGGTYDEVTRLLQGYVENEVDMNSEGTCRETCAFYEVTKSHGCFKELFCSRQPKCSGKLLDCQYVDSDMWICPSQFLTNRRYDYIEYESGRTLGRKGHCTRGRTKVDSWWRYLFWHCSYCFCICDEKGPKSDRYFNLRETISDIDNNMVISGIRFIKVNRVFHLRIQEGQLLPRGMVNSSSLRWKPVDSYQIFDRDVVDGKDYHTLDHIKRIVDLDDVKADDPTHVVTGVRFRVVGTHLNLEARLCEYDFVSGKLISPRTTTYWKSNDNNENSQEKRTEVTLRRPDIPISSPAKSLPTSRHNQFIKFTYTDMDKDAAQTTVPFIDIQEVTSKPPVPLSGVGIYHKGRDGFGGFLAPKLITYDFTSHVSVPQPN